LRKIRNVNSIIDYISQVVIFVSEVVTRIVRLIKERGISGVQLGKLLGNSKSPVTDWKNGKSKPTLEQLSTICEYFAISADYLLFGKSFPLLTIPPSFADRGYRLAEIEPSELNKDERILLKSYARLGEDEQTEVLEDVLLRASRSKSKA
jgi:transcriptional regulator with XRE-family HTH domain